MFHRRLIPKSITGQLTGLVIAAVIVGVGLASILVFHVLSHLPQNANENLSPTSMAARIALVANQAEALTQSHQSLAGLVQASQWPDLAVEEKPLKALALPAQADSTSSFDAQTGVILRSVWHITPVGNLVDAVHPTAVIVPISQSDVLIFDGSSFAKLNMFILIQSALALMIIIVITLFVSIYAIRWIIAPLSSIAEAARSFTGSSSDDATVVEDGPVEISQVACALNEMRRRVTSLIDERTQILVAISHDLRTPLTRLRLRIERLKDADEKNKMLHEVDFIKNLITETLTFFRDGVGVDPPCLVDLPSLLKTVCSEFNDFGYNVTYNGLHRVDMICRPRALTRAITNIVDNATKYGSIVGVFVWTSDDGQVHIEISDDGPGIPENLRNKVFVPFFRGDISRRAAGLAGFGLGLSIARDIIEDHGGRVSVSEKVRRGTQVDIMLSAFPKRSLNLPPA